MLLIEISVFNTGQGSEALNINLKTTFSLKTSSAYDVITPIKEYLLLVVPETNTITGGLSGIGPSLVDTIKDQIKRGSDNASLSSTQTSAPKQTSERKVSLDIGKLHFNDVIVLNANVELSKQRDTNNYPTFGSISLDIATTHTFDSQIVNEMFS